MPHRSTRLLRVGFWRPAIEAEGIPWSATQRWRLSGGVHPFALLPCPPQGLLHPSRPPSHIQRTAAEFDRAIRCTLETIVGGPVSHWSWLKASLPCSRGGLNLRSVLRHSPAAFLVSTSVTKSLVLQILASPPDPSPHITPTVSRLATEAARPDWKCLDDIDVPLWQKCLSHVVDEACFQQLLDSAPTCRSRALALSSSLPHAGDWLNIIPSTTLGLHLHDREFQCCLRYWLGVPLHSSSYPCPECHLTADAYGDHQVGCGGDRDRISRHNAVCDAIHAAAQSAALAPSKETPGLLPGSPGRHFQSMLEPWTSDRL